MCIRDRLIVISGPSGAGKGTLLARVLADFNDLVVSVSATTRSRRAGEREGRDYHFLSRDGSCVEWRKASSWSGLNTAAICTEPQRRLLLRSLSPDVMSVSYTHLRAHETKANLV